ELPAVVDARKTSHLDEVVPHHFMPQCPDFIDFCEETVASDIKFVPLVLLRARNSADPTVLLQNHYLPSLLHQLVSCRQTGRASTDNYNGGLVHTFVA